MSNTDRSNEETDPLVLRVRGLPWSASKDDILKFFEGCNVKNGTGGIHMTMSREGRPSGEAYVEFETEADADKGLEKNNEHLGSRYIEVFRAKPNEMSWSLQKSGIDGEEPFEDTCVRLRGIPFGCSKEEIAQFFSGLEIVRNGITLPTDFEGRSTGEAYVQFASQEVAEKAMGKHKEKIGHRYIEIFKSSKQEIRSSMGMGGPMRMGRGMGSSRFGPYDRPGGPFGRGGRGRGGHFGDRGGFQERVRDTGHNVHMRGLPFRAVEKDIFEFFSPIKPVAVRIKYEASGRPSGEADAMFGTHDDAVSAMEKDKEKIQHRYIELFLESMPDSFSDDVGYDGGSRPEPYGSNRNFMPEDGSGYGMGRGFGNADRGFGSGSGPSRGFGGGPDSGYSAGSQGAGPARGYGMGAPRAPESDYNYSEDKPFSQGYGTGMAERNSYPSNPADPRAFGRGAANQNRGGSMGRSFGGADAERPYGFSGPDRFSGGERGYGMDGYRNGSGGMQGGNTAAGRTDAAFSTNNSTDSDFYGTGKLFGNNFQSASTGQGMNMMNPTTYPGF